MAVDRTGRILKKGDWVYDINGVYEVEETDAGAGKLAYLKEVYFNDDIDQTWYYAGERILTTKEVQKLGMF